MTCSIFSSPASSQRRPSPLGELLAKRILDDARRLSPEQRLLLPLRLSGTDLLGESMSSSDWWQVAESRFPAREEAEEQGRATGEMFVARYQNKPAGLVHRLLPIRETK